VKKNGFEERVPAGVVLTGGASMLEGVAELAERVLGLPARVGSPKRVGG
jgi:cell division protein FtsA